LTGFLISGFSIAYAQQQDVPEPVFVNFSIQPPYVPTYHGRDPFKPLDNVDRSPQISIAELEYHGVIFMEGNPMALFTWRGNEAVRYTLKFRKLYSDADIEIDGVVGDITDSEITLVQGDQKVVYPRK
jgi:hypothetical protein